MVIKYPMDASDGWQTDFNCIHYLSLVIIHVDIGIE